MMDINLLLNILIVYTNKSTLPEYEFLLYEQLCRLITNMIKNLNEELENARNRTTEGDQ